MRAEVELGPSGAGPMPDVAADTHERVRMKVSRTWQVGALVGVLVVVVAACSSSSSKSTTTTRPKAVGMLVGKQWALSADSDLGVRLTGVSVTAEFANARVTGSSGCNTYGASYTVSGANLSFGAVMGTQMACPAPQTAVETAYLARLPKVKTFAIKGTTLTMFDAGQKAILVYDAIDTTKAIQGSWNVTSIYTGTAVQSPINGTTLTAVFDATRVSGSGGCNQFSGDYSLPGPSTIKIGRLVFTAVGCVDPAGSTQEQQYFDALALATTYTVTPTTLQLLRPDGTIAVTFDKA